MRPAPRALLPVSPDELELAVAAAIRAAGRRTAAPADDALIHLAAEHVARHLATAGIMPFRQGAARAETGRIRESVSGRWARGIEALLGLSDVVPVRSRHA